MCSIYIPRTQLTEYGMGLCVYFVSHCRLVHYPAALASQGMKHLAHFSGMNHCFQYNQLSTKQNSGLCIMYNVIEIYDSLCALCYRVVSSDVAAAEGVVSLMRRFDWTRVAVVTQQETIFTSVRGKTSWFVVLLSFNFSIILHCACNSTHLYM